MMEQKYTRSQYDHYVYFLKQEDGSFIYLPLYIDDMLIASKSTVEVDLMFEKDDRIVKCVVGFVDSDYAGDLDKRRSTTKYVLRLQRVLYVGD